IGEDITRLRLPLSRALLLFGTAQAEVVMLQHPHRHAYGACGVVYDIATGDDLREVFAHRLADFLVMTQPVARSARKQVVPLRGIGTGLVATATRGANARISAFAHDDTGTLFERHAQLSCRFAQTRTGEEQQRCALVRERGGP